MKIVFTMLTVLVMTLLQANAKVLTENQLLATSTTVSVPYSKNCLLISFIN